MERRQYHGLRYHRKFMGGYRARGYQDGTTIKMSDEILAATSELRSYLFEKVYRLQSREREAIEARGLVTSLYRHFLKHPHEMPPEYLHFSDEAERCVVDYIAGMTDHYATNLAKNMAL